MCSVAFEENWGIHSHANDAHYVKKVSIKEYHQTQFSLDKTPFGVEKWGVTGSHVVTTPNIGFIFASSSHLFCF